MNGRCGLGSRFRYRNITMNSRCKGLPCPPSVQSVNYTAGCCPENCTAGEWAEWGSCSALCGWGTRYHDTSRFKDVCLSCLDFDLDLMLPWRVAVDIRVRLCEKSTLVCDICRKTVL